MTGSFVLDDNEKSNLYVWILGFNLMYFVLYFAGIKSSFYVKSLKDSKQHPFSTIGAFGWLTHFITCLIWPFVNIYCKILILFNFYEILYPFMVVAYGNYFSVSPIGLIFVNCLHHYGLTVMLLSNGNDNYIINIALSMIWILHLTNCQLLPKKWRDHTETFIFALSSIGTYLVIFLVPFQSIFDIISLTTYIASRYYFYTIVERLSKNQAKLRFRHAEFWCFALRCVLAFLI